MRSEQTERIKIWLECLKKDIYSHVGEVKLHRMTTYENLGFKAVHSLLNKQKRAKDWDLKKQESEPVAKVFYADYPAEWGRKWEYGWFAGTLKLSELSADTASENNAGTDSNPDEEGFTLAGRRLELIPDVGGEMLIEINGELAGSHDLKHDGVTLTRSAEGDEEYEILIESYAGHGPRLEHAGPLMYGDVAVPEPPHYQVKTGKCSVLVCNDDAYGLYIDVVTLWQLYNCLDEKSLRAQKVLAALFKFTRIADFEAEPEKRNASYREARKVLKPALECVNGSTAPDFALFGQSHLDLAWKWTTEETRRKCARTYSTQLSFMDEFPDFKFFGCSPYIFESIRKDYPELFKRIKKRVAEGRITVDGGMYVESDTNMPTGEALIRQILYAKEWYRQYFNTDTVMVWLPDCFGFSGQLPQIMAKSGIKYFSTQKLFRALEGAETFPYNDFVWEGIDGTRIVSHMHKKNNARLEVSQIYDRWYKDRVQNENFEEMMFPFGYGDGGGGVTREMLETAERGKNLEGCPKTQYEDPVSFMERLDERMKAQAEESGYGLDGVNLYKGEIYLPWHRGTYTSQAGIKFANRKTEATLHEADLWCSIAIYKGLVNENEMRNDLKDLWIRLMFLQFHDVLPGTSIERVNAEALEEFGKVNTAAMLLAEKAKRLICNADKIVWNPISVEREIGTEGLVVPSCGYLCMESAASAENAQNDMPFEADEIIDNSEDDDTNQPVCFALEDGSVVLSNGIITATVDAIGRLKSCILGVREFISEPANAFRLYKDINIAYDAWELATFYRNEEIKDAFKTAHITDFGVEKKGLVSEAYVEVAAEFSDSALYQRISLAQNGRQVEFTTGIDWHETHKILRVDFPTVINTDSVICETQYGYVKRPNHRSKQSDADRFEGCMHRYAALAEDNCGVILLNDGKYGCGAEGGTLSMTCLKAAKIPDANADMGQHYFSYAFRPYTGGFAGAGAAAEGMIFNSPVETGNISANDMPSASESFFDVDGGSVILDWVKPAEDGSGDLIIRLYESMNSAERAVFSTSLPVLQAFACNCIEQNEKELTLDQADDGRIKIELSFKPFEIKTIRLRRKRS